MLHNVLNQGTVSHLATSSKHNDSDFRYMYSSTAEPTQDAYRSMSQRFSWLLRNSRCSVGSGLF